MKGLVTGLIEHGRIETTTVRAKAVRPLAERLVTRAKNATVADRRILAKHLGQKALKALVEQVAPRFSERQGGYTRIVKLGRRRSDSSEMALIEFVA